MRLCGEPHPATSMIMRRAISKQHLSACCNHRHSSSPPERSTGGRRENVSVASPAHRLSEGPGEGQGAQEGAKARIEDQSHQNRANQGDSPSEDPQSPCGNLNLSLSPEIHALNHFSSLSSDFLDRAQKSASGAHNDPRSSKLRAQSSDSDLRHKNLLEF